MRLLLWQIAPLIQCPSSDFVNIAYKIKWWVLHTVNMNDRDSGLQGLTHLNITIRLLLKIQPPTRVI